MQAEATPTPADGEGEMEIPTATPEADQNDAEPAVEKPGMQDETGTKIDYSNYEPIPFKKTSTLVNYFIINTAQFLNAYVYI